MSLTLNEFYEKGEATEEQISLLEGFRDLAKEEINLVKKVNEAHKPFQKEARREEARWGSFF